jgi:hypothetical protein
VLKQTDDNTFVINNGGSVRSNNLSLAGASSKKTKFVLAVDYDEVIVNINHKWMQKLLKDEVISNYFSPEHRIVANLEANLRTDYDVFNWLGIKHGTPEFERGMSLYFNDPKFYSKLKPTKYFESIYQARHFFSEIHIITKCGEDLDAPCNIDKKRQMAFLFRNFDGIKLGFHFIKSSESKAQYFKQKGIKFDSFVDDAQSNMLDMINVFKDEFNFEALMPLYCYNFLTPQKIDPAWIHDGRNQFRFFHNLESLNTQQMGQIVKELEAKQAEQMLVAA